MAEIIKGLENIPQTLIDEIKDMLKETHDLKNNYSDNAQKNITKRINEIDRLIQAGYQRLLKNNNPMEEKLWNSNYKQWRAEKEQLRIEQARIDKDDDEYYKQSELILKFCKNANSLFLNASPSEKRTICGIIGSNFTATDKDIDITLYPIFYDIIEVNNAKTSGKARFELPETSSGQQKRASKKALNLNGGNDEARTRDLLRDRQAL